MLVNLRFTSLLLPGSQFSMALSSFIFCKFARFKQIEL